MDAEDLKDALREGAVWCILGPAMVVYYASKGVVKVIEKITGKKDTPLDRTGGREYLDS